MLSGVSVHPADDLLGDVCELLLVCAVPHLPDALHGGLLVLGGQQLGLLQTLAAQHQPEVELQTKVQTQVSLVTFGLDWCPHFMSTYRCLMLQ